VWDAALSLITPQLSRFGSALPGTEEANLAALEALRATLEAQVPDTQLLDEVLMHILNVSCSFTGGPGRWK
jgi:hypothetical protein